MHTIKTTTATHTRKRDTDIRWNKGKLYLKQKIEALSVMYQSSCTSQTAHRNPVDRNNRGTTEWSTYKEGTWSWRSHMQEWNYRRDNERRAEKEISSCGVRAEE